MPLGAATTVRMPYWERGWHNNRSGGKLISFRAIVSAGVCIYTRGTLLTQSTSIHHDVDVKCASLPATAARVSAELDPSEMYSKGQPQNYFYGASAGPWAVISLPGHPRLPPTRGTPVWDRRNFG